MRDAVRLVLPGLLGIATGCATADPPPGGEEDRVPPVVISVTPEPGSTISDLGTDVEFAFDERLSERGVASSVLVSPRTGDFRVDKGGREIRVRQAGGWSPGIVYRVTLLPGVGDLFGNARSQPVELVFSTGPEIPGTVLGGVVTDRMTGAPLAGAAVAAVQPGDTVPYVAIADEEGFFAIRFLPPGPYVLRGFRDGNGDWAVGAQEPRDEIAVEVTPEDTLVAPLALLFPDTTPPSLVRAEWVDSVTVRLDFDDALDPEDPQASLSVRVVGTTAGHEPGATPIAPHVLEAALLAADSAAAAAADSVAGGEADAAPGPGEPPGPGAADPDAGRDALLGAEIDSLAAAGADSLAGPAPPPVPRAQRGAGPAIDVARGPDGAPLPTREWYVRLDAPLVPGATYLVFVSGARNVQGAGDGGGEVELAVPEAAPEPAPEDVPPDPLPEGAAPPDSADGGGGAGGAEPPPAGG
ncbi:MAG TPA: Ig-like domain-containing protein [Longimicrobiales bacterium]|nr:Ig-like domain-containing protein [Longimicrobiales bacterium]